MRALAWHGTRDVRVDTVPDPEIAEPNDAIVRITTSAICGSDLHLYEVLTPYLEPGDILGHEPMGIVEEVGPEVDGLAPGDRVVIPFTVCCGHCFMCRGGLHSQCETTQVREQGMGAALYGYTSLYGSIPGGQAEYMRVQQAQFAPIKVPPGLPDERFIYLSDVLPTSWQAVSYAGIPEGGSVLVFGLGPIGQISARIARLQGARVIAVDLVPERIGMAQRHDIEVLDAQEHEDLPAMIREMTDGRGADSVIDAVGMEAHGSTGGKIAQKVAGMLPDSWARNLIEAAGVDRMEVLHQAIASVRRGGTISIVGVYGGTADPLPMRTLFDRQIQLRMGQANVKRWVDDLMPLVLDEADPLDLDDLATHTMPLDEAPRGYDIFQKKEEGAIKVLLKP